MHSSEGEVRVIFITCAVRFSNTSLSSSLVLCACSNISNQCTVAQTQSLLQQCECLVLRSIFKAFRRSVVLGLIIDAHRDANGFLQQTQADICHPVTWTFPGGNVSASWYYQSCVLSKFISRNISVLSQRYMQKQRQPNKGWFDAWTQQQVKDLEWNGNHTIWFGIFVFMVPDWRHRRCVRWTPLDWVTLRRQLPAPPLTIRHAVAREQSEFDPCQKFCEPALQTTN